MCVCVVHNIAGLFSSNCLRILRVYNITWTNKYKVLVIAFQVRTSTCCYRLPRVTHIGAVCCFNGYLSTVLFPFVWVNTHTASSIQLCLRDCVETQLKSNELHYTFNRPERSKCQHNITVSKPMAKRRKQNRPTHTGIDRKSINLIDSPAHHKHTKTQTKIIHNEMHANSQSLCCTHVAHQRRRHGTAHCISPMSPRHRLEFHFGWWISNYVHSIMYELVFFGYNWCLKMGWLHQIVTWIIDLHLTAARALRNTMIVYMCKCVQRRKCSKCVRN